MFHGMATIIRRLQSVSSSTNGISMQLRLPFIGAIAAAGAMVTVTTVTLAQQPQQQPPLEAAADEIAIQEMTQHKAYLAKSKALEATLNRQSADMSAREADYKKQIEDANTKAKDSEAKLTEAQTHILDLEKRLTAAETMLHQIQEQHATDKALPAPKG